MFLEPFISTSICTLTIRAKIRAEDRGGAGEWTAAKGGLRRRIKKLLLELTERTEINLAINYCAE